MIAIREVLLKQIKYSAAFLRLSHVVGQKGVVSRLKGADVGRNMGTSSL
jgi:hypothetical protein